MGLILCQALMRLDYHQQRLHLVFLRSRHYPLNAVACIVQLLEKSLFRINDMLLFILTEEVRLP